MSYIITSNDLLVAGYFSVDSGQAMVGDPSYLDDWNTNENDDWNLEGKIGEYSYHGATATTVTNSYGELGNAKSIVFSTGRGDGMYPVYVMVDEDGIVSKVVIDFMGDIETEVNQEEDDDVDEDYASNSKLLIEKSTKIQPSENFEMVTELLVASQILGELYTDYKEDKYFSDFVQFNDLGLPLAYFLSQNLCGVSEDGERYITETWRLFLSVLGLEDLGWESLDQILEAKLANG